MNETTPPRFPLRSLCLLFPALLPLAFLRAAPPENSVLVLGTGLVLQSKLDLVVETGRAHGFSVTTATHEKIKDEPLRALLAQSAWLIVDTPRPTDFETLSARLAKLGGTQPPRQLWVGRTEQRWSGLDDEHGALLWAYYRHGGRPNFTHLFDYLQRWQAGRSTADVPPPQELPAAGAYHPRFPLGFSADVRAVLDAVRVPGSHGVVGIGFHASYLESAALEQVDALVEVLEKRGVTALPLFYSIGPDADLPKLMQGLVDVHFHLQPVYHTAFAAQLDKLGIPVLQGIGWSDGGVQDYREDRVGLPLATTPLYLALPEQNGLIDPMVGWARGTGRIEIIPEQIDAMADKAVAYVRLQSTPRAERRLAVMVYNYPPGERNMAASFMNIPRSLERISTALNQAGYTIEPRTEAQWIDQVGRVIRLHLVEHVGGPLVAELREDVDLIRLGHLLEGVGETVVGKLLGDLDATLLGQIQQRGCQVGGQQVGVGGDELLGGLRLAGRVLLAHLVPGGEHRGSLAERSGARAGAPQEQLADDPLARARLFDRDVFDRRLT